MVEHTDDLYAAAGEAIEDDVAALRVAMESRTEILAILAAGRGCRQPSQAVPELRQVNPGPFDTPLVLAVGSDLADIRRGRV